MSCINQYEVDLRGNKIAAIENLGATEVRAKQIFARSAAGATPLTLAMDLRRSQNQFDSIDLSDNAIVKLEGFPRLLRLKQILLNNNRVSRIAKKLEGASETSRRPHARRW
jgi:U2 small nuclear ribonucleoprotein A'